MAAIISVRDLRKVYAGGFEALKGISLDIEEGEIIALLGPNGAGKTTLISSVCGITNPTSGAISVGGFDVRDDFRQARQLIGLVPQEITVDPFEKVVSSLRFSRGLFGLGRDDALVERVLRDLSLWEKRDARAVQLSGGMKRRLLIAKALVHEPRVLFLDEPTAGVDVELRKDMWDLVGRLRADGVTIILTTHYIEEAEAIADRIGVIRGGELLLVEEKAALMTRLGRKELRIELSSALSEIPDNVARPGLALSEDGRALVFSYDTRAKRTGITALLKDLQAAGIVLTDIQTRQSSLEDIFVDLMRRDAA